jgi:nicotinic acid mononucleotide adenylyltransferase
LFNKHYNRSEWGTLQSSREHLEAAATVAMRKREEKPMAKGNALMPYGYEPEQQSAKGTVLALGLFDDPLQEHVPQLAELAVERSFARIVFVPQHDETLRRMKLRAESPYYERVRRLKEWIAGASDSIPMTVDEWEGKRQKYTPLDALLRFATDKYKAPHIVALSGAYANVFASYASFDEWIRRVRLIVLAEPGFAPHLKLANKGSRWEAVDFGRK